MVKIKEVQVTANYAWSPAENHPVYIAAGTAAQQLDATFSSNAKLELYSIDMADTKFVAKSAGKVEASERFQKVVWGAASNSDGSLENGVIVCGTDKGNIEIYDPSKVVGGEEDCLVLSTSKHTGPVRALDFNKFQTSLFASGANDSEIFIWDLKNPTNPMTPGKKTQPTSAVSSLAWNRQVQHIIASTTTLTSGPCCVVWDLRKNEPIIKVQDPAGRMQCSDAAWHPEVATQLVLASEDDHCPVVQLWDLRFATSPMKVLEKHTRGIVSLAWCSRDPDLLLTCAKDNQILCWNPNASPPEVLHELETHAQWCFDVQWCPRNPNVISTGSYDGHISIHSLMGGGAAVEQETAVDKQQNAVAEAFGALGVSPQQTAPTSKVKVSVPLKKPPKWMRVPCGVSFAFGGKLVIFNNAQPIDSQQQQSNVSRSVTINQVVTEMKLLERSHELRQALADNGQCAKYCHQKLISAKNEFEEDFWNFLKANFEAEPRRQYLHLLGYDSADLKVKFNETLDVKPVNGSFSPDMDEVSDKAKGDPDNHLFNGNSSNNSLDAFSQIAEDNEVAQQADKPRKPLCIPVADGDLDSLISQALLIGDYKAAVDLCFHGNRMADAIIVAMAGGSDLLEKTQNRYFALSESKINKLLSSVVKKDWQLVVETCELDNWKEAFASLLTYASHDELLNYCDKLGERLEENEKYRSFACLCYVCSGNIEKFVKCWDNLQLHSEADDDDDDIDAVQDIVEKILVLLHVVGAPTRNSLTSLGNTASQKLECYSAKLAAQGQMGAAMEILPRDSEKKAIQILRDRLFHSQANKVVDQQAPPFPFATGGFGVRQRPAAQVEPQRQVSGAYNHMTPYSPHPSSAMQPVQQAHSYDSVQPTIRQQEQMAGRQGSYNPYVSTQPLQKNVFSGSQQQAPANMFIPASTPISQTMQQPAPLYQPYSASPVSNGSSIAQPQFSSMPPPPSAESYMGVRHNAGGWNDPPTVDPTRIPRNKKVTTAPTVPTNYMVPTSSIPPVVMTPQLQIVVILGVIPGVVPLQSPNPQPFSPQSLNLMTPAQPSLAPPGMMHPGAPTHPGLSTMHPGPIMGVHHPQQPQLPHQEINSHPGMMQNLQQNATKTSSVPTGAMKDVPKAPIPAEHQVLQNNFDELIKKCQVKASNPHMKRKLEECSRRLEFLYDKLRANKVSPSVASGLHQVAQSVVSHDYVIGLQYHSQIVSHSNFSEISAFMPGLKSMLQIARQLHV